MLDVGLRVDVRGAEVERVAFRDERGEIGGDPIPLAAALLDLRIRFPGPEVLLRLLDGWRESDVADWSCHRRRAERS